jgi:hypothetical protein
MGLAEVGLRPAAEGVRPCPRNGACPAGGGPSESRFRAGGGPSAGIDPESWLSPFTVISENVGSLAGGVTTRMVSLSSLLDLRR